MPIEYVVTEPFNEGGRMVMHGETVSAEVAARFSRHVVRRDAPDPPPEHDERFVETQPEA
jgi:hypothetical protein